VDSWSFILAEANTVFVRFFNIERKRWIGKQMVYNYWELRQLVSVVLFHMELIQHFNLQRKV
jgi:hypothetical protein